MIRNLLSISEHISGYPDVGKAAKVGVLCFRLWGSSPWDLLGTITANWDIRSDRDFPGHRRSPSPMMVLPIRRASTSTLQRFSGDIHRGYMETKPCNSHHLTSIDQSQKTRTSNPTYHPLLLVGLLDVLFFNMFSPDDDRPRKAGAANNWFRINVLFCARNGRKSEVPW